ncbi:MAG: substrate-binding domain-containing protein [Paracoccaceae bacterium]
MFINFGARLRVALPILATATLGFAAGAHAEGEPVLGVALPNLTNPLRRDEEELRGQRRRTGFEVRVLIADNDDAEQLAQVQTFVEAGVNAVALNCVSSGPCVASVQELNAANIPVFTVNLLPDAQGSRTSVPPSCRRLRPTRHGRHLHRPATAARPGRRRLRHHRYRR